MISSSSTKKFSESTLYDEFAPLLRAEGVSDDLIRRLIYRIYVRAAEGVASDSHG